MGYSISYNSGTTTPFGTYKQGTITMGLKPDEYTVSSGFTWYANAETPNDNYLIISDTYSQGWSTQAESKPTIWRSETGTTESFVSLVNQLPDVNGVTGFTDSGTAMKYLMDSGKYFVNKDDYLGIVTDGLILNLDAGWYPSYSGSGTTWKDIKGTNNGTLTNGPTFSSNDGGSIVFDGTNDYVNIPHFDVESSITVNVWVNKISGNSWGGWLGNWIGTGPGDSWLITQDNNSRPAFYVMFNQTAGDVVVDSTIVSTGVWYNFTGVFHDSQLLLYRNSNLVASKSVSTNTLYQNSNEIWIGKFNNFEFNGNIAISNVYNRALSAEEILQNYNATKGRFGL